MTGRLRRRDFVRLAALSGVALTVPVASRGQGGDDEGYEGPYFVFLNASGGWDTTYLMDPKGMGGINRLYDSGEILSAGQLDYAPRPTDSDFTLGMSNRAFFGKYFSDLLVVNGIDISVNNHDPCSRYVATGKLDSLAYPTAAALIAASVAAHVPLAFMTFGQYSATANLVPQSRVPYLSSLEQLGDVDYACCDQDYNHPAVLDAVEVALQNAVDQGQSLPKIARARSTLFAAQINSKTLDRIVPFIPSSRAEERLHRQVDIALAGFASGLAATANLAIGQFDSHDSNDATQMQLIPEYLLGVDYMVERAGEMGLLDDLVIVMQSEMGRTPTYNGGDGKDHWSIGSTMFMGSGITGNRVVGATDEEQVVLSVDPKSLELDAGGIHMRPEHIHLALRELAGIDGHALAKRFDLDVPNKQRLLGLFG